MFIHLKFKRFFLAWATIWSVGWTREILPLFSQRSINWEKCFVVETETILKQNSKKRMKNKANGSIVLVLAIAHVCYEFSSGEPMWWLSFSCPDGFKSTIDQIKRRNNSKRSILICSFPMIVVAPMGMALNRWNELVMCVIWMNVCACENWPSLTAIFIK